MGFFLEEVPLVATLENFRKCAIRVSLPNSPELGFTDTLEAAVCSKMFFYVGTSSPL